MNPQQAQQLQPQQPTITITDSVYDDIGDYYDELIDLDKEQEEPYDHPGAGSGRPTPNLYQRLGDEAVNPTSSDHDDKSSDNGEYADLDRKTRKDYEPPDAEPGHATPNSYQQLDTPALPAVRPITSVTNPIYLELIDDEVKATKEKCGLWSYERHAC